MSTLSTPFHQSHNTTELDSMLSEWTKSLMSFSLSRRTVLTLHMTHKSSAVWLTTPPLPWTPSSSSTLNCKQWPRATLRKVTSAQIGTLPWASSITCRMALDSNSRTQTRSLARWEKNHLWRSLKEQLAWDPGSLSLPLGSHSSGRRSARDLRRWPRRTRLMTSLGWCSTYRALHRTTSQIASYSTIR